MLVSFLLCCSVLFSILSFVFWIFPPLDTALQLESADSKQNPISKNLFQDSFWHIFWVMRKMHHTFWKKETYREVYWVSLKARFRHLFKKQTNILMIVHIKNWKSYFDPAFKSWDSLVLTKYNNYTWMLIFGQNCN